MHHQGDPKELLAKKPGICQDAAQCVFKKMRKLDTLNTKDEVGGLKHILQQIMVSESYDLKKHNPHLAQSLSHSVDPSTVR